MSGLALHGSAAVSSSLGRSLFGSRVWALGFSLKIMAPAATLRILVRNIESDAFARNWSDPLNPSKLQFSDFSIEHLYQGVSSRLQYARKFFPEAGYEDCLLERNYWSVPPAPGTYADVGAIPHEAEDLLFLLRLFRPGDLAFVELVIEMAPDSPARRLLRQRPYRVISDLIDLSTRQYRVNQVDVPEWERFSAILRSAPSWGAAWFNVARRFFLYGGSKEFNPNFDSDVDRLVDYVIALEAAVVPESDFVGRRLRERVVRLLGLSGDEATAARRLFTRMYDIRSTLVHGSRLNSDHLSFLRGGSWSEFEHHVRNMIVRCAISVPADEVARRSYLVSLWDVDDSARAEKLIQDFKLMKSSTSSEELFSKLAAYLPPRRQGQEQS